MHNSTVPSIESWLRELSGLLGSSSATISRAPATPMRVKGEGPDLLWWRCSAGSPAVSVWVGLAVSNVEALSGAVAGGDTGAAPESGTGAEFCRLLNKASGITGELVPDYPAAMEYETYRIPTSAIGEIELFSVIVAPEAESNTGLGALMDVELPLTLRFGSTRMPLSELTGLSVGSVIEFENTLSDPVELMVNGRVIARGEAVVLQGCYALRISEIASPKERMFSADHRPAFQRDAVAG